MLRLTEKISISMGALATLETYPHQPLNIRFSFCKHFMWDSPPLHPPKKYRTSSKNPSMASCLHIHSVTPRTDTPRSKVKPSGDVIWLKMREEALSMLPGELALSSYYQDSILLHDSLETALVNHLSIIPSIPSTPITVCFDVICRALLEDQETIDAVREDLRAVLERDPACVGYAHCFLNYKGFLAVQSHRVAHRLWSRGREALAFLIQSRVSKVFAVDIHPGARIGRGVLLDHATGFVVGATAVIGSNVSILHSVTLGGTGKASRDRHPKIGDGVLIGAETCILGNIRIGEGAKIRAGSLVPKDVPPRTTAVGNPARLVGGKENPVRSEKMPSLTIDHISVTSEWSDYVI